jgi:PAS domain S-box-containing protein
MAADFVTTTRRRAEVPMRALIAVDSPELAQLLTDCVRQLQLEPALATDLPAALKLFAEQRPQLVLASCSPGGIDGLALCRELRKFDLRPRAMIEIVAPGATAADLQAILDAGADDYLVDLESPTVLQLRLQIAVKRMQSRANSNQIQRQLRESVERFDLAVRGANEGLWDALPRGKPWHDPNTEVWYSPRCKELLGFRDDEFPNVLSSWETRLHPDDRERVIQALRDHIERKESYDIEYRLRTKSGEYRWFSARGQAIWDEQGQMVRMAGSLRDTTQTREYAAKLEQSEAKWRSLVENAPDLILLVDPQGTIQFINRTTPGFESTIGRTMYDYIDKEFWDIAHRTMEEVCTTGAPQYFEALVHRPDGGTAWYATRSGAIWHNGRVESVVRIATDITHRKIADEELKRERHLLRRLLDLQERERQIVAYDIHDGLVQYLTGGLMHLEAFAVARGRPAKTSQDEYERGMGLLRDALAEARRLISGLRPPILDEQGVVAALEYLINESRADIGEIQFVNRTHFGRLAAPLEAAIFRITQEALTNIRRHSHSRKARLELWQHGDWIRLLVRDWGCGFEPGRVQEERFGLQGIRQRARLLGTIATIESAPGKGTVIVVDFPIISEHQPESFSAG